MASFNNNEQLLHSSWFGYDDRDDDDEEYYNGLDDQNNNEDGDAMSSEDRDVRLAFEQQLTTVSQNIFNMEHDIRMNIPGVVIQNTLSNAIARLGNNSRSNGGVFATPALHKSRSRASKQMTFVKRYLKAYYNLMFQHMLTSPTCVAVDECIVSNMTFIPIHFDVEIKQEQIDGNFDAGFAGFMRLLEIENSQKKALNALKKHVLHGSTFLSNMEEFREPPSEEVLIRVANEYVRLSQQEWTPGVCRSGVDIIENSISRTVGRALVEAREDPDESQKQEDEEDARDMKILTACRADKFSLHIIMQRVYCESPTVSMPLVAFEIAREFDVENTRALFGAIAKNNWEIPHSDEMNFRIRALMLNSRLDANNESTGYNDGPFDEAIYSTNHLLRAPGGVKMSATTGKPSGVPMTPLRDLRGDRDVMPPKTIRFSEMYDHNNEGLNEWMRGMVMGCVSAQQNSTTSLNSRRIVLISGLEPSESYPLKRTWAQHQQQFKRSSDGVPGSWKDDLIQSLSVKREIGWTSRFQESRKETHENLEEARDAVWQRVNLPWERTEEGCFGVKPDELFTSEGGEEKRFAAFKVGEWFRHKHNGRTERTASAKVIPGGFICYGCKRKYQLPVSRPFENPYPFLETEVHKSQDPNAYIPKDEIDWETIFRNANARGGGQGPKPKMVVLDAHKGMGKTEACARLCEMVGFNSRCRETSTAGRYVVNSEGGLVARAGGGERDACCWDSVIGGRCEGDGPPQDLCGRCNKVTLHYTCQKTYEEKHCPQQRQGVQECVNVRCVKCHSHPVSRKAKVCVVSFRQGLAQQQALRFGLSCYLHSPPGTISDDGIVIVVNSLGRLSELINYDIVILDEAGMIRRHFVSPITETVLARAYQRFATLIQNAKLVVMLQHGITREDVRFYSVIDNIDPEDRRRTIAMKFEKPYKSHPIKFMSELPELVVVMLRNYKKSIISAEDGSDRKVCNRPFIVYSSTASFAEFICYILKKAAKEVGGDASRIHLLTRDTKQTDFNKDFLKDSNRHADKADVVVCTAVIGAGFDISTHFHCWYAVLWNKVLSHQDELQFIFRLREQTFYRAFDESGGVSYEALIPEGR